jgi:N-acetyl-anhydromuramyl-L-alanine amidase AmpD
MDSKMILGIGFLLILLLEKKKPFMNIKINDIVNDLPNHPTKTYSTRNLNQVNKIVVHHTAGTFSHDAYDINRWHTSPTSDGGRDWPRIGYHFFIDKAGNIFQVNNLDTISYHTAGNNTSSIGVALEGSFDKEILNQAQKNSLTGIIDYLRRNFPQTLQVYGHGELQPNKPLCPSVDLSQYKFA